MTVKTRLVLVAKCQGKWYGFTRQSFPSRGFLKSGDENIPNDELLDTCQKVLGACGMPQTTTFSKFSTIRSEAGIFRTYPIDLQVYKVIPPDSYVPPPVTDRAYMLPVDRCSFGSILYTILSCEEAA